MTPHCQATGLHLSRDKQSKRTTDILASSMGGSLFGMTGGWEGRVAE